MLEVLATSRQNFKGKHRRCASLSGFGATPSLYALEPPFWCEISRLSLLWLKSDLYLLFELAMQAMARGQGKHREEFFSLEEAHGSPSRRDTGREGHSAAGKLHLLP